MIDKTKGTSQFVDDLLNGEGEAVLECLGDGYDIESLRQKLKNDKVRKMMAYIFAHDVTSCGEVLALIDEAKQFSGRLQ